MPAAASTIGSSSGLRDRPGVTTDAVMVTPSRTAPMQSLYDRLNTAVFRYVSDLPLSRNFWRPRPARIADVGDDSRGGFVRIIRLESLEAEDLRDYRDLTDVVLRRLSEPAGGLYIAESTKVIERALRAGHRPRSVLTLEKWLPEIEQLLADQDADVPVFVGDGDLLEGLT